MPINVNYDEKIKFYDKIYKIIVIIASLTVMVFTGIGVWQQIKVTHRIDDNIQRTQAIINANQRGALEARQNNINRQVELKNYFKCLILLRYDAPTLTVNSSRADTEVALDNCAKVNNE